MFGFVLQQSAVVMHLEPMGAAVHPMGGGFLAMTSCVHCGVWLCVVMSWYGKKNAGKDGSPPCPSVRLIAAIQSLGCWQALSNGVPCAAPGCSALSGG